MSATGLDFSVNVAGAELDPEQRARVASIEVASQVDRLARATLVVDVWDERRARVAEAVTDLYAPGAPLRIGLGARSPCTEVFAGEITGIRLRLGRRSLLEVSCRCAGVKLLRTRVPRVVAGDGNAADDVSAEAVLRAVADAAGIAVEATDLAGAAPHALFWRSDGWRFALHAARRAGCVAYVRDGRLRVVKPAFAGGAAKTLTWGSDLTRLEVGADIRRTPTSVVARTLAADHGSGEQAEAAVAAAAHPQADTVRGLLDGAGVDAAWPLHDAAAIADAAGARHVADACLERLLLRTVTGRGIVPGDPGLTIDSLVELAGVGPLDGPHYVSRVEHRLEDGRFTTAFELGLPEAPTPQDDELPEASAPAPARGLVRARVESIQDPARRGCVQVSFPWMGEGLKPVWAPVAMPGAGKAAGLLALPEPGDEVLVAFLDGDLAAPVVVGGLWNQTQSIPAAYEADGNDRRAWVSRSGHQIVLDDAKDAERIAIYSKDGQAVIIDDGSEAIEISDKTGNIVHLSTDGIALASGKGKRIVLDADGGSIALDAAEITLNGRKIAIAAAQCAVEGQAQLELKGAQVGITGNAMIKAAAPMITLN